MASLGTSMSSGLMGKLGSLFQVGGSAAGGQASSQGLGALSSGASGAVGSELSGLGGSDTNATASSLGSAVSDAQSMTTMQMQASSAMAKMNMMASINDGLNSVMKKAGDSFKSAAQ